MSTKDPHADDYAKVAESFRPEPGSARAAGASQRARRASATSKERITIRLDTDVVEQFKALAGGAGYQALINVALREWLVARSVRELVRDEVRSAIRGETQGVEKSAAT